MKTTKLLFLPLLMAFYSAIGQYKTVTFNYERSAFNDGQPLPAESYFTVSGEVSPEVELVEIRIFSGAKTDRSVYKAIWKRPEISEGNTFQLPISYRLRSNSEYSFRVAYYKRIDAESSQKYRDQLYSYLDSYVDQSITQEKNHIRLNTPIKQIIQDLNAIVERANVYYNNRSNIVFPGFSDLVVRGFENLKNKSLSPGKHNQPQGDDMSNQGKKNQYGEQKIDELKDLIKNEVGAILSTDLLTVTDSKDIQSYPTEKLRNSLTLSVGYGGVYFDGDVNNLSYGSAPYAGFAFPLGNQAFAGKFLSKTTLSVGVFLTNLSNGDKPRVSGPIVGRPVYAGLGYPILDFLRFNAGVVALQNTNTTNNDISLKQVFFRPYVGLSIDVNVWFGLGKNKL